MSSRWTPRQRPAPAVPGEDGRRGASLGIVLVVMVTFSFLGLGLINQSGVNTIEVAKRRQAAQSFWSAEGGLYQAKCRLENDPVFSASPTNLIGTLGNVPYSVEFVESAGTYTLTAAGTPANWRRTLRMQLQLAPPLESVRDEFNAASYAGDDGTLPWSGPWVETDDQGGGASSGLIRVVSNALQFFADIDGDDIQREADLTGATTATLTFAVDNQLLGPDTVRLEISSNGGGAWAPLKDYTATNQGAAAESFDISAYVATNTRIRIRNVIGDGGQPIDFDDVQIEHDGGPGARILSWEEL